MPYSLFDQGTSKQSRVKRFAKLWRFDENVFLMPGPCRDQSFRGVRLGILILKITGRQLCRVLGRKRYGDPDFAEWFPPYEHQKNHIRMAHAVARVTETGLPFIMVNQQGGQDELVFDGASFVLNADRSVCSVFAVI